MREFRDGSVELTVAQAVLHEVHSRLMDYGFGSMEALYVLQGRYPSGQYAELRSEAPLTDAALTAGFCGWVVPL